MDEKVSAGASLPLLAPIVVRQTIPAVQRVQDQFALIVATCGVGYIPIVPATLASAVTGGIYWILLQSIYTTEVGFTWLQPEVFRVSCLLAVIITLSLAGIWSANRVEKLFGHKDPRPIVIDEVVGQLTTLLFVPRTASFVIIVIGFFVFRAFDILKPYPIRRLESLPGGVGVMADDLLAGVYGAILMALIVYLSGF